MPDASFNQPSFLGGEWSLYAQGRIDDKRYRTAMAVCFNSIPVEEGAAVRRPGFAFICTTRNGVFGRVLPFDFTDTAPFSIELTSGHLRMIEGRSLVFNSAKTVTDVSSANPAIVTTSAAHGWATNDQIQFLFQSVTNVSDSAVLRNRQFKITVLNGTQFTMTDPITGIAVSGADINWDPLQVSAQVARVLDLPTPYTQPELNAVRRVQAAGVGANKRSIAILLHGSHQPQILNAQVSVTAPNFSEFIIGPLGLVDGPYMDHPTGVSLLPSGTGGAFTVQISYNAWSSSGSYSIGDFAVFAGTVYQSLTDANLNHAPNVSPTQWTAVNNGAAVGTNGFQAGDVGRLIRILTEPDEWNGGATYSAGQAVKFNDAYYVAQNTNSGAVPDTNLNSWLPTTSLAYARWVWGQIIAINSSSNATIVLLGAYQGLLYLNTIRDWRIGVYSDAAGWPTCGAYYEGRLWLGGVVPNRFDASVSNDPFNFAPTAADGTVGDANAISNEFNSDDQNTLYWMEPTSSGLLCGTKKGEWLIAASNLKDPITPTSIQADRVTKVGCFNQQPAHTPLTMVIIQRYQRLLFEVFPDLFSGKISAPNLNVYSKHLTAAGVAEVAYQSELAPIVWARNNDNTLVGWTYRRVSAQSTQEPEFVGGHRHQLGSGRTVASMCVSPTPSQTSDAVFVTTVDPTNGVYHVEQMTRVLDPADALTSAWFVDDAVTPSGLSVTTTEGVSSNVTFFGLWHLNGKVVSAVCGGLDLGDYTVVNGSITVPFLSDPGKQFTLAYLQSLNGGIYGDLAVPLDSYSSTTPGTAATPQVINLLTLPETPVSGNGHVTLKQDYANNVAWMRNDSGYRKVSLTNFTQLDAQTHAAIALTGGGLTADMSWDWTRGSDGYIYTRAVGSNQSPWIKINPATWSIVGVFGVNSNFFSDGATGFGPPISMVHVFGGANYLAASVLNSAFNNSISWMNADTFTFVPGSSFHPEIHFDVILCAGPQGATGATVYGITIPTTPFNLTPDHFTLYRNQIDAAGVTSNDVIATINASAIDPTWTNFSGLSGFIRDAKDGQLLIGFSSIGGPANTAYMCKVRVSDGSIIWRTPVVALPGNGFNISRSTGGVMSWIGESSSPGTRYFYILNTVTGQINKVIGITNVGSPTFVSSDDVTGTMLLFSSYSQTPGSPVPGPTSPSAWTDQWSILTAGNIFFGGTTSKSRFTIPAVVGFTYTSRGQIVRPALPQEAGAANGPASGKTRRNHMFSVLLAAAIYGTVFFGTVFGKLRPANFKTPGGTAYDTKTLFQGVHWNTIEDNYDFDGMIAWEITRPLPCSVVSIGGFLNTQDR